MVHTNRCKKIPPCSPDMIIGNLPDADELSCLGEEDSGDTVESSNEEDQRTSISQNQVPVPIGGA